MPAAVASVLPLRAASRRASVSWVGSRVGCRLGSRLDAAAPIALLTVLACVLAGASPAFGQAAPPAGDPAMSTPPAPAATAPAAGAATCDGTDLIRRARVTGTSITGSATRVSDGQLVLEGSLWNVPQAVQLTGPTGQLVVDLGAVRTVQYFVLQGDDNDQYPLEGSIDGTRYRLLWSAPAATTGPGLRTRLVQLPKPEEARYLRVRGQGGDGFFSLSELRAHCKAPSPWPPKLLLPPKLSVQLLLKDPKAAWKTIDNTVMVHIKGWAAVVGTLVLLGFLLWRKPPTAARWVLNGGLALSGVFAFASWWNLGHYHFDHYEHVWEHYHYYMGAKYAPELRFSRLYECTAVADMADGLRARVKKRKMRDLGETNQLGSTARIMAEPKRCTDHFTPERWEAFRTDLRFFRGRFSRDRWDESQGDHGYNGTPVWGLLGRAIADYGPLSWDKIRAVAWIDSGLLVAMWVVVWWAFGWQSTCVALLYWGYNFPARFYWNGGSMLRYDWMLWLVVGICFLRKRWHFAGGMALTYATLLRVFPGFVVAALVLKALARMIRLRKLVISRGHATFAAGCITAMLILIPASSWSTNGLDAWVEFAHNSDKHLKTALTNNMGLKTALGYDFPTAAKRMRNDTLSDPFQEWKDARAYYYGKSKPILIGLLVLFCILLARAADREPDWAAACLGAGLIPLAAELTCYYYGFLLTYGLLWERRKIPGVLATALAAVTCLFSEIIAWNDDHFAAMSLATFVAIVLVTYQAAFGKHVPHEGEDAAVESTG
jgi:hypothetical protein